MELLQNVDDAVWSWLQAHRNYVLDQLMGRLTHLGDGGVLLVLALLPALVIAARLFARRQHRAALWVVVPALVWFLPLATRYFLSWQHVFPIPPPVVNGIFGLLVLLAVVAGG